MPANVDGLTDALELAMCDAQLRARLADQGRDRAREYSWQRAAERLLDVYRGVAAA